MCIRDSLQKYRNKLAGWENRYFKLDRTYLHYSETKDSPTSRKTCIRTDVYSVYVSSGIPDRPNCLEITLKNGDKWIVQCVSEFEMKEWAKALLAHVPDSDIKRKAWLDEEQVSEPTIPVPQMPQYMLPPDPGQEPPSYRTAIHLSLIHISEPTRPY